MDLWALWTNVFTVSISMLTSHLGISEALSIMLLTLCVRAAMMPISLAAAYQMHKNKLAMAELKSMQAKLSEQHKSNPAELIKQTMALYREHGISFLTKSMLVNLVSRSVFGMGFFHALSGMSFTSKFLWLTSLAKPNFVLNILVGVLMFLGLILMPGATSDTSSMLILMIPVIISIIALSTLPAAIGVYWASSNAATIVQALLLRGMIKRAEQRVLPI
ncbi:MAG: membrane protein insertase YidC [Proteobacteria bacterium]|nr:membrane protein insertase YidC [Pseudomonadota bacterium]